MSFVFTCSRFMQLPIIGVSILILSGCNSLKGTSTERANQLSVGMQSAYSITPNTANRLAPLIIQSAEQHDVPATLLTAIIRQESNFRSHAKSSSGAIGLTQIIPRYWQNTCSGDLYNEAINIKCGAYILAHYYEKAGNWNKALGYYNVGPTGYENSFWTRHKAKKYIKSVKKHERNLKEAL